MKVYWFRAQAPQRVLALVKHLGLEAEFVEVDLMAGGLKTPEYAALNPNMKAPTLVDGDLVLWEASAIMAHLCIKAGSDMWPAHDPAEQVEVLRRLSWNDCHWAGAVAPFYFEHIVKATFGMGPADTEFIEVEGREFDSFRRSAGRSSGRAELCGVRQADHRRLSVGLDGGLLAGSGDAAGGISQYRALARRVDAHSGVGRSVAGRSLRTGGRRHVRSRGGQRGTRRRS